MLLESNNVIAENLARHVALATGAPASFAGAAAAEAAVLRRLGVTGVAPGGRQRPVAATTGSPRRPWSAAWSRWRGRARAACGRSLTGLPVAGFSGTLAAGGSVFAAPAGPPSAWSGPRPGT